MGGWDLTAWTMYCAHQAGGSIAAMATNPLLITCYTRGGIAHTAEMEGCWKGCRMEENWVCGVRSSGLPCLVSSSPPSRTIGQ